MSTRRSSKEPVLHATSPLAPIVGQLKAMARGLTGSLLPDMTEETGAFVRGKVEGLESAITLLLRAGASGAVTAEGQHLVQIARSAPAADPLEQRVAALERQMSRVSDAPAMTDVPSFRAGREARPPPAILEPPAPGPPRASTDDGAPTEPQRKLLAALASRSRDLTRTQLALLTGYAVHGGGFSNLLSELRKAGWMVDVDYRRVQITVEGVRALGPYVPPPSGAQLLEQWKAKFGKAPAAILTALAEAHPRALTKGQLAHATGYNEQGGGFSNAFSDLRGVEIIERGWPTRLAEGVFFEGGAS